jgi:hypothetical protein
LALRLFLLTGVKISVGEVITSRILCISSSRRSGLHEDRVRAEHELLSQIVRLEKLERPPVRARVELVLHAWGDNQLEEQILDLVADQSSDLLAGQDAPRDQKVAWKRLARDPTRENVLELRLRQDLLLGEKMLEQVRRIPAEN